MFDFSISQSPWGSNRGTHQLLGCGSIEQLLFTWSPANARHCFQCFSSTVSFNLYNTSSKRAQRNNSCLINEENEAVLGGSCQETYAYLGLKPQESYQGKCLNGRKEGKRWEAERAKELWANSVLGEGEREKAPQSVVESKKGSPGSSGWSTRELHESRSPRCPFSPGVVSALWWLLGAGTLC